MSVWKALTAEHARREDKKERWKLRDEGEKLRGVESTWLLSWCALQLTSACRPSICVIVSKYFQDSLQKSTYLQLRKSENPGFPHQKIDFSDVENRLYLLRFRPDSRNNSDLDYWGRCLSLWLVFNCIYFWRIFLISCYLKSYCMASRSGYRGVP